MPKTFEIELKRAEEPEDDTMDLISDEELERRHQEGLQRVEKQKQEFLPERRRSIMELKRE